MQKNYNAQNAYGASNVQQGMVVNSSNTIISGEHLTENTDSFVKEITKAISLVEASE